jgi:hypothetical protein
VPLGVGSIRSYVHTFIHTYIHTFIPSYLHTYTHSYVHTYIHTYIRSYVHTNIHTHIHAFIHIRKKRKTCIPQAKASADVHGTCHNRTMTRYMTFPHTRPITMLQISKQLWLPTYTPWQKFPAEKKSAS